MAVGAGVYVGKGVRVAVEIKDAVGVAVGAGEKDAQDEKINVNRKSTRMDEVNWFRMC